MLFSGRRCFDRRFRDVPSYYDEKHDNRRRVPEIKCSCIETVRFGRIPEQLAVFSLFIRRWSTEKKPADPNILEYINFQRKYTAGDPIRTHTL